MDIKLEKKKGWRALLQMKNLPYAFGGVFIVFVIWLLVRDNASTLRVDADVVTVSEVEAGEFNDYVRLTGTVQPITTVQISPLETGVVERIVAEEGTKVKKGDVIVEMSNNSLSMQILQSEADLAEKQNILRNTLISMEQERLSLRQEQLQLDIDVERKRRDYERKERLYKNELLSQEEWMQAKEDYELALNRRTLNTEKQRQDSLFRSNQVGQMEESLHSMTLNMQLIRERVDNLKVKAPIDGEVGMLDIVLGQSVGQGTAIGQVNDLSASRPRSSVRIRASRCSCARYIPRCAKASSDPTSYSRATSPRIYAAARHTTSICSWGSPPSRSSSRAARSTSRLAARGYTSSTLRARRRTAARYASDARTRSITRSSRASTPASG